MPIQHPSLIREEFRAGSFILYVIASAEETSQPNIGKRKKKTCDSLIWEEYCQFALNARGSWISLFSEQALYSRR
jgi:hypothetical protein